MIVAVSITRMRFVSVRIIEYPLCSLRCNASEHKFPPIWHDSLIGTNKGGH
jgi:hypothetical protein